MKSRKRSLSPAELRYFRIGPKVLDPQDTQSRARINSAIQHKTRTTPFFRFSPSLITLNKLPKPSYGNFESTLRNFNLIYNKHYGLDTVEHQVQKFGERARVLTQKMVSIRKYGDRTSSKQKALRERIKAVSDTRREIVGKSVKNGEGMKLRLKSFELKGLHSTTSEILPLTYLRILVEHANSYRLESVMEASLKMDGNQLTVQFQRIVSRISDYRNTQVRYQKMEYVFQAFGKELKLTVPVLEICSEINNCKQTTTLDNKDILEILNSNFENGDEILDKYFDQLEFVPCDQ